MKQKKVSASALSYAILFVLLLSLIAGALLSIFSAFNQQAIVFQNNENLFLDNKAALQFAQLNTIWKGDSSQLVHPSGDTSRIHYKKWGLFDSYAIKTFKGNQHLSGLYLIGGKSTIQIPSLVAFGGSEGLKITGKTKLEGNIFLTDDKIDRAYIAGKNFEFNELFKGKLAKTKEHIWELISNLYPENLKTDLFDQKIYAGQNIDQSHFDKTLLLSGTSTSIQSAIKGNVIFYYSDSIHIESSAQLENICIYAPLIRIKKGFKGSVQLFSTEQVIIEDSVELNYPSSIVLKAREGLSDNPKIELGNDSKVLGGVVLISEHFDFRKPPRLIVNQSTFIAGIVYNVGTTELYGSVFGHLYTGNFECHIAGGIYTNHLVDATISSCITPTRFGIPKIFTYQNKIPSIIVSCKLKK